MNNLDLNNPSDFKHFLQEYHKVLTEKFNFPPLSVNKASHAAAPLFGLENWHAMSKNMPLIHPSPADEKGRYTPVFLTHPVFHNLRDSFEKYEMLHADADKTENGAEKAALYIQSLLILGDNDECANKHLRNALEAITEGRTWAETEDYALPGIPNPAPDLCPKCRDNGYWRDLYAQHFPYQKHTMMVFQCWSRILRSIDAIGLDNVKIIADEVSWGGILDR